VQVLLLCSYVVVHLPHDADTPVRTNNAALVLLRPPRPGATSGCVDMFVSSPLFANSCVGYLWLGMGKWGRIKMPRGSEEAQIGSTEALQSLYEGLPNPIYPSL